jgi:hypothetical protein
MKYSIAHTLLLDIPGPVDGLTRRVAEDVRVTYKLERDKHTEAKLTHLIPEVIKEQIDALRGLGVMK